MVLLRNPFETRAAPLLHAFAVSENSSTRALWAASGWEQMTVAQLLGTTKRRAADYQPSSQDPSRKS